MNNFAMDSGVARVVTNGYFEFYSSVITQNYAKRSPLSFLFDSVSLSLIDNCEIFGNIKMTDDQILNEVVNQ